MIEWPDGHMSEFEEEWLQDRAFTNENLDRVQMKAFKMKPILWGSEYKLKIFGYSDLIKCDKTLLTFLEGTTFLLNVKLIISLWSI